jgi:hypothetical protein
VLAQRLRPGVIVGNPDEAPAMPCCRARPCVLAWRLPVWQKIGWTGPIESATFEVRQREACYG